MGSLTGNIHLPKREGIREKKLFIRFCFSALYGASFAFFFLLAQKFNLLDDNNHNNLFSARVSFFAAVLALLGLIATSVYAIICPNKDEFIEIQSYISIIPVCNWICDLKFTIKLYLFHLYVPALFVNIRWQCLLQWVPGIRNFSLNFTIIWFFSK